MNIFVGNLSFKAAEVDVHKAFLSFGAVTSVAIVTEKKSTKSRGFGFVEMPDEAEALAAIAGLDGQEILGRPINVIAALPKKGKSKFVEKRNKHRSTITAEGQANSGRDNERKNDSWADSGFQRTGEFKRGRRTRSFMLRRVAAGITTPVPKRKYKENPMRWRKKKDYSKPRQKIRGESKPGQKRKSEPKPERRTKNGSKAKIR